MLHNWNRFNNDRLVDSGRVSYGADDPKPRWFPGGQNCAGACNRRIGRQRSDAIGACLGCKTCDLEHDQSQQGHGGEGWDSMRSSMALPRLEALECVVSRTRTAW